MGYIIIKSQNYFKIVSFFIKKLWEVEIPENKKHWKKVWEEKLGFEVCCAPPPSSTFRKVKNKNIQLKNKIGLINECSFVKQPNISSKKLAQISSN